MKGLGEKLKRAREERGLGQKEVAELTGINYKTISNYETDRSEPDVENLAMLCRIYDISADYFINIKKAPEPESPVSEANDGNADVIFNMLRDALLGAGIIKPGQDINQRQARVILAIADLLEAEFSASDDG